MALNKLTYVDNVTVIPASNLNAIQDEVIANGTNVASAKSEVEDIRVGADGTTYASAGDSVRGQISPILNSYNVELSWTTSGYIKNDGTVQGYTNFHCTPFIPVEGSVYLKGNFYYLPNTTYCVACYDENKTYLGGLIAGTGQQQVIDQKLTLPTGTAYIRISDYDSQQSTVSLHVYVNVYELAQKTAQNTDDINDVDGRFTAFENVIQDIYKATLSWTTSGYIKNDGTVQGYTNFHTTPFIPVSGQVYLKGTFIYLNGYYFVSCYDSNKSYLGGLFMGTGGTVSVDQWLSLPVGTAYIRITDYDTQQSTVELCVYSPVSIDSDEIALQDFGGFTAFSKFCTVGDSLSVGYYTDSNGVAHADDKNHSWGKYVEKLYGSICYWTGKAGETSKTWLEQTADGSTWGLKYAQELGAMPLYFVCFGANEASLSIGTSADIEAENPTTLYGYVGKMFRELRSISPNCYIIAVGVSRQQDNASTINAVYEYACGYYDKCYYYNVQPMLQSEKFTECYYSYHYSALGYMRMGIYYNEVLNTIMSNNVSDFLYINDAD